jgi:hypothetical protein
MRRLLQSLRLRIHPELNRLISMAWAVHRYRVRQPKYKESGKNLASEVSRSSVFYASTLLRPRLREIFEEAGLDFEAWTRGLEVSGFEPEQPLPARDDIEVEEQYFSAALKRYSEVFLRRSVDAAAIVFGLLATAEGGLGTKRLTDAGMSLQQAAGLLFEEMRPEKWTLSIVELNRFELSEGVDAIVKGAKRRAASFGRRIPLTASLLMITLAEAGTDPSEVGPASFLREVLNQAQPDRFDEIVKDYLGWYGPYADAPIYEEPDEISAYVPSIFKSAQELARYTSQTSQIHRRHLLGALLTTAPGEGAETGAYTFLRSFHLDPEKVAEEFLSFLREKLLPQAGDDIDAWELHLSPGSRRPLPARVPQIDSEMLGGPDLLRIKRDVEAFATLIAANSFEPPLSIGLFGDWGSGKSFFMAKLREHVKSLAGDAEKHRQSGKLPVSHRRIVQIEFNAWHYAEVNLWASLVTHIFEELYRPFSPQDTDAQKWDQALKKLDEATLRQASAETVLKQAEAGLESAQVARKEQKLKLGEALQAAWNVVAERLNPSQRKELEATLDKAMLGQLQEELLLRREEALRLKEQWRSSILMRALSSGKSIGSFALVLVLAVALYGLVLWFSESAEVQSLAARLAEIVTFVGGISAWLGSAFKKTSGILSTIEDLEKAAQAELDATPAGKNLREAEKAFSSAQSELAQRQREVEEIRAEIQELRPGQQLSRFLQERAASSDYRKHLGLPALVQRDFKELQRLMRVEKPISRNQVEAMLASGDAAGLAKAVLSKVFLETDKAELKVIAEGLFWDLEITDGKGKRKSTIELQMRAEELVCRTLDEGLPQIDRIILYIDDLDRCPPRQVVNVLQAIHLLLAVPLFVVVVGVDARWISRSLRLHYRELWRHIDPKMGAEEIAGATPLDYLEKIFQIPFWLEPLSPEVTEEYLEGLIAKNLASTPSPEPSPSETQSEGRVARHENGDGDGVVKAATGEPSPAQPPAAAAGGSPSPGTEPSLGAPPPPPPAAPIAEPSPEPLVIEKIERDFMLRLAPLVGRSPRTVKRFLNTYRVFRAGLDPGRLKGFLGTQETPGDFREVQVLLGLICGAPDLAPEFFRYLLFASKADTLDGALEEVDASEDSAASVLRTRPEWKGVEHTLRRLNDRLNREDQRPLSLPFLQENARSTIRYSFDWEPL